MIALLTTHHDVLRPGSTVNAQPKRQTDAASFAENLARAAKAPSGISRPSKSVVQPCAASSVHAAGPHSAEALDTELSGPSSASARVFNQDGFFGRSVEIATAETGDGSFAAAATSAMTAALPPPQSDPTIPLEIQPPSENAFAIPVLTTHAQQGLVSHSALMHASGAPPKVLAGFAAPRPSALETQVESRSTRPIARSLPVRPPTARTPAYVALQDVEHGIHVAVRANVLDPAEHIRLHDEIAALLARHGLSVRGIRISAPVRAPSQETLK